MEYSMTNKLVKLFHIIDNDQLKNICRQLGYYHYHIEYIHHLLIDLNNYLRIKVSILH